MSVPILKHGDVLIATLQEDPSDAELITFEHDLTEKVGAVGAALGYWTEQGKK